MDPMTAAILTSVAANYFSAYTQQAVFDFFETAINLKPSLATNLHKSSLPKDFEAVFSEAIGVIDAQAGNGQINVNQGLLEAIRGIRFDHQHGTVTLEGSTIRAPFLQTGGSGSGITRITDSNLFSQGTGIHVGQGAYITMTGGATIRQT